MQKAILVIGLALFGCHSFFEEDTNPRTGKPTRSAQRADEATLTRLQTLQTSAKQYPGAAKEAIAFSEALTDAYVDKLFVRQPQQAQGLLTSAVEALDKAAQAQPLEAPYVLASKGVLYLQAVGVNQGVEILIQSVKIRPNITAGVALAVVYGNSGFYEQVGEVCRRTTPYIKNNSERYQFIKVCIDSMHASSEETGLAWASAEDKLFYEQEKNRLAALKIAAAQEQQKQQEYEAEQLRQVEKGIAKCKEKGYACMSTCGTDELCQNSCQKLYDACLDQLEAQYK